MIITVTLNAALDKTVVCDRVERGGIIRATEALVVAGGKGINVARTIFKLGGKVLATGFAGGSNGVVLRDLLTREGIPFHFLPIAANSRMCLAILEKITGAITEIYDPSPAIQPAEWDAFKRFIRELAPQADLLSLDGSLPAGLGADAYYDLILQVKAVNPRCRVILDTSGPALQKGIQAKPFMIKPNRAEMEALVGAALPGRQKQGAAVRALLTAGIELVVLSLGEEGVIFGYDGGIYHIPPLKVEVQSAVGCGDALVGGFAYWFNRTADVLTAVKYGAAAATANLTTKTQGDVPSEAVAHFFGQLAVERLF